MKILVMSDSHRNISSMLSTAGQVKPDVIIHLGDHIIDARELQRQYPEPVYYSVPGNCDSASAGEAEMLLTLDGVLIFLTHGHRYSVKSSLQPLIEAARGRGAALALFGHTHNALVRQLPGLWLLNPGQMAGYGGAMYASYGIINTGNGLFDCGIVYRA